MQSTLEMEKHSNRDQEQKIPSCATDGTQKGIALKTATTKHHISQAPNYQSQQRKNIPNGWTWSSKNEKPGKNLQIACPQDVKEETKIDHRIQN